MQAISATKARNEWSAVVDSVIREKPKFIKRTRDHMFLTDLRVLEDILSAYTFHAEVFAEDDGSVTVSLDEIELAENAEDEHIALTKLAGSLLEYSEDYYQDFAYWSRGDRKAHIPYILKALITKDIQKLGDSIQCRPGKI